jgi:RHS repeat-associated protein
LIAPFSRPAGITHYIYDTNDHLIAEATGTSAASAVITREYLWLEGMPIAVIDGVNTASPVTSYVHTDHLARPIRLTNAAKATTWSATWLPHGGAHATTGTATQNLRFPGQYFLIEQGLAYNWHRFYDATTGRYTQPDPLGFPDGPSRYAYAINSPLMYVDPTGITYAWDSTATTTEGIGRLANAAHQGGYTAWLYDGRGNVTRENRIVQAKTYSTLYQYDGGDKVSQITYPSGRIVIYARNALGQVTAVTTKKNATAAVANVATGVAWSAMSDLVTGFTYGNGLVFTATYDLDYRIATLKVMNGAAHVISLSYAYEDGAGLLANDGVNLTAIADNVTPANSQSLWYTPTGRLQNASGPYGDLTFYMDSVGNRTHELKAGSPTKVLGYPATSNRLVSETTGTTLTRSFTYDGAGNMLTGLPAGAVYALDYNKRNRPSALKQSGTTIATYLFNAQEQLVSRAVTQPTASTTHYIYDIDGRLIAEAAGTSAATAVITREYLWLDGMPVAVIDGVNTASPVTTTVHTDHLTRPIRMTNANKATVWQARWLPSGGAYSITGTATQNLRFPGQYFLIEQGLAYNWHRFYDPTTGRYTQPDPYGVRLMADLSTGLRESYDYRAPGFHDGPSKYAYAKNSPLMNVDPDGRAVPAVIAACLANPPCAAALAAGTIATANVIWNGCTWLWKQSAGFGGGGGGDDDDGGNCKKVAAQCRATCSDYLDAIPWSTRDLQGMNFHRCVNQCVYDQNCGGTDYPDGWDNGKLGSPRPWNS